MMGESGLEILNSRSLKEDWMLIEVQTGDGNER
jgi:hypothetical protein